MSRYPYGCRKAQKKYSKKRKKKKGSHKWRKVK